jgi:hypothetical protein
MTPLDEKNTPSDENIFIPHHYVKIIISAATESQIGFSTN